MRKIRAQKFDEVRRLYQESYTYQEIHEKTGVSGSVISRWCKDLIELRREQMAKDGISAVNSRHRRKLARTELLTDDNVLAIRADVRLTGMRSLKKHATKYHVSVGTVQGAINGRTFKHLDAIEPPITKKLPIDTGRPNRKWVPPENLLAQAMQLRREDPEKWSYAALAEWLNTQTGKSYVPAHISRMFVRRDPSFRDVADVKSDSARRAENARRLSLRKMREEEDRLEKWHAAGRPDDWVWV